MTRFLLCLFCLVFGIGYSYAMADPEEEGNVPQVYEDQNSWQQDQIQTAQESPEEQPEGSPENEMDTSPQNDMAENEDTQENNEQQNSEQTEFPRLAESMERVEAPHVRKAVHPHPHHEEHHVIPQYEPPKVRRKDEEPFIAPQWLNDDGIGNGRDPKIIAALEAITADLIGKGKTLTSERKWAKKVDAMLQVYQEKVANVHAHSEQLREEMRALMKKKRQIENIEVQHSLTANLRSAQEDMESLEGAMNHVQSKADEYAEKKKKLEAQIAKISHHLKNLQGVSEDEEATGAKTENHSEHSKKESVEKTSAEKHTEKGKEAEGIVGKEAEGSKSEKTEEKGKKAEEEASKKTAEHKFRRTHTKRGEILEADEEA